MTQVRELEQRWELHGRLCLVDKPTKQTYSFEVKKEVVERFLAGETRMDLAREFHLSSPRLVKEWVTRWRRGGDGALTPKLKGRPKGSGTPPPLTEEDTLRREIARLQAENAYLKKIAGLAEPGTRLKVQAIVILKSDHDLADLLQAAGVARSTYYYHAARLDAPDKYAELKDEITELFYRHKRRFGHRRIRLLLRRGGWVVSKKLVFKLMDQLGLKSKVRTKRKYTSYQGTISHIADNHLGRKFSAAAPNRKWVSDVTEFRIAGSKVYLSPVYDLFDHCVVSHTLGLSPFTALTATSLNNALSAHNPGHGIMVHTDQGFQYQHTSWHRLLEDHEAAASMSRKGNCYDNAVMENFFGHLKAEMYHGEHFSTVEDFTAAVDEYIEWYNTERVQERLEGMTPMEYRNHALLVTRPA